MKKLYGICIGLLLAQVAIVDAMGTRAKEPTLVPGGEFINRRLNKRKHAEIGHVAAPSIAPVANSGYESDGSLVSIHSSFSASSQKLASSKLSLPAASTSAPLFLAQPAALLASVPPTASPRVENLPSLASTSQHGFSSVTNTPRSGGQPEVTLPFVETTSSQEPGIEQWQNRFYIVNNANKEHLATIKRVTKERDNRQLAVKQLKDQYNDLLGINKQQVNEIASSAKEKIGLEAQIKNAQDKTKFYRSLLNHQIANRHEFDTQLLIDGGGI